MYLYELNIARLTGIMQPMLEIVLHNVFRVVFARGKLRQSCLTIVR
jgi:hypothetical protein